MQTRMGGLGAIRETTVSELAPGDVLFVPAAFAAYRVGVDGVARSLMGPGINGSPWTVLAVDGTLITARRNNDGREITEDAGDPERRVLVEVSDTA